MPSSSEVLPLQAFTAFPILRPCQSYSNSTRSFAAAGTALNASIATNRFSPSQVYVQRPSCVRFPSAS